MDNRPEKSTGGNEPEDEIERRMNDAVKRALNTPPQPRPTKKKAANVIQSEEPPSEPKRHPMNQK